MIVLFNPISTTPGKQPLPLSLMSLAAVLETPVSEPGVGEKYPTSGAGDCRGIPWTLVDGNVVRDPAAAIIAHLTAVPRTQTPLLYSPVAGPAAGAASPSALVARALPRVPSYGAV
jgi:hypothetical protein